MSKGYYDKRAACAMIAERLAIEPGWKVLGYKGDKSDSMTDYYDPATWYGYAEGPNGFILVSGMWGSAPEGLKEVPFPKGATWALFSPEKVMVAQSRCANALHRCEYGQHAAGEREAILAEQLRKINLAISKGTGKIRHNVERNGIEVLFPSKPSEETREWLKQHGFRWSKFQGLWYGRFSPDQMEEVQTALQPKGPEAVAAEVEAPLFQLRALP